ncbi:MAG: HAD family hydrolase [Deltaproteobacteria bacterium]|nr:HAD family hydrolase [Deltaproteobacteria bacterium]
MSTVGCLILDFDGTLTLVDEEAGPFIKAFREGLSLRLGEDLSERWEAVAARIEAQPDRYGWEHEGYIVAPAHADPYVLARSIGQILLEEAGFPPSKRHALLDELYLASYPHAKTVFRPEAQAFLEACVASGLPVYVVSNTGGERIKAKLENIVPHLLHAIGIKGNARKFVIAPPDHLHPDWRPLWEALPATCSIPGLTRAIHLHRGHYFALLTQIWDETRLSPEETLVCGDIFELDLAMPAQLGAQVHLVFRPQTAEHEKRAARSARGGGASPTLKGLFERLDLPG